MGAASPKSFNPGTPVLGGKAVPGKHIYPGTLAGLGGRSWAVPVPADDSRASSTDVDQLSQTYFNLLYLPLLLLKLNRLRVGYVRCPPLGARTCRRGVASPQGMEPSRQHVLMVRLFLFVIIHSRVLCQELNRRCVRTVQCPPVGAWTCGRYVASPRGMEPYRQHTSTEMRYIFHLT